MTLRRSSPVARTKAGEVGTRRNHMTSRLKRGALIVAITAMLMPASAAIAKGGGSGGGGGGGASCATLNSFTNTPSGESVTTSYSIFNGCVDEHMSSIAIDYHNL